MDCCTYLFNFYFLTFFTSFFICAQTVAVLITVATIALMCRACIIMLQMIGGGGGGLIELF